MVWGAEHLTIHNATDGQVAWSCGNFNPEANKLWPAIATPVIVGGVFVASISHDKLELLSENNMGESVIGSPVPASNRILIRGEQHLFCVDSERPVPKP